LGVLLFELKGYFCPKFSLMAAIDTYNFNGKRALIRVDFNVPLDKESLKAVLPTSSTTSLIALEVPAVQMLPMLKLVRHWDYSLRLVHLC